MKKFLLSLFVLLIGLINFGYCELIAGSNEVPITVRYTSTSQSVTFSDLTAGMKCFNMDQSGTPGKLTVDGVDYILNGWKTYCTDTINNIVLSPNGVSSVKYYYFDFPYEGLIGTFFPQYTSLQCQTEYNLIPISSVDQNYCLNNGLCPSGGGDCPVCPGSGDNWSALYINDIQHLGKPIINITFPDYLDWDYTTTENEFNLDIVGYPVDTEYIDGIIRTQNYKPTSEDFTQLVLMLAPYSKYLLFLLFIFIIWAWIKKPFKSKKL